MAEREEDEDTEDEGCGPPLRMTPLEMDVQLQCAELIFRSVLEGRRLGLHPSKHIDDWHREILGHDWCVENQAQRDEVARQSEEAGEGTPEFLEAVSHVGDLAWEVFDTNGYGEVLRRPREIDRAEVLSLLGELRPRLRDSRYARCGAGAHLYGLRAMVALFRLFCDDAEVVAAAAECLTQAVRDVRYNRDGVAELSLALPPECRCKDQPELGWAFLRAALDAYLVQLGEDAHSWVPDEVLWDEMEQPWDDLVREASEDSWPERDYGDGQALPWTRDVEAGQRDAAFKVAECILAVRPAPAATIQLKLLAEAVPEGACAERRELVDLVPRAVRRTELLLRGDDRLDPELGRHRPLLTELLRVLSLAEPREEQ